MAYCTKRQGLGPSIPKDIIKFMLASAFALSVLMNKQSTPPPIPKVSAGQITRLADFPSKYVAARNVDIWVPDGYSSKQKYNVLYMHDGQMLFDAATTWNHQEWTVDETLSKLINEGKVAPTIVVGVWNTPARHPEYFPQKPLDLLDEETRKEVVKQQLQGKAQADNYLKFLVQELKPYIDSKFSTYSDSEHTSIAGSSMGGLISMYAICEYPDVFGSAACISTHWPGVGGRTDDKVPTAFLKYLDDHFPAKGNRIYFDHGDKTLDAMYPKYQKLVDERMALKKLAPGRYESRFFPGDDHSETSWARRLHYPLEFLLKR